MQTYVNWNQEELSKGILDYLPSLSSLNPSIIWVSPLQKDKYFEYQDKAFLDAMGFGHLSDPLSDFWPRGGPVWDALASIDLPGNPNERGVLLVEAKSHPPEVYGGGMQAKAAASIAKIMSSLSRTKEWLGVNKESDWTGPLYQSANRLAHLYFFREIVNVPTWLVNIYFVNDPHSPTDYAEWQRSLMKVKIDLGIRSLEIPYIADIFLEAMN